jgi:hypothetical protein
MAEIVAGLLEDLIRGLGWASLKLVTAGRYKSSGDGSAHLFEGTLGLLIVAGACGVFYYLWRT